MYIWTAGQRIDPSSRSAFIWRPDTLSDTVSLMIYTNWNSAAGEPDYHDQNQACVAAVSAYSYAWHDVACSVGLCSICETDM